MGWRSVSGVTEHLGNELVVFFCVFKFDLELCMCVVVEVFPVV